LAGLEIQAFSLFGDISRQASAENVESLKASDAHEKSQLKIKQDGLELQATAEEDYRNKQILAELAFLEKREAFAIEQAKKIADINRKAFIDDAEMGMTFAKLKADNDKKVAVEKERQQKDQLSALGDLTTNLGAVLGEQNALFKASAITQAIINTHNAATGAYAALAPIPIVGPALGGAAAGVALAAGFKNVQAIASAREQGGNLSTGQASTVAERDQLEVFIPSSNGKVKTANQLASLSGNGGGGNNVTLNVIDQSSGSKEFTQETKSDGEIILLIRNTVSADISTSNTQIDKSLSGRGQARQRA
jgi:DNA gyrase/topoisomerase IV subunit A